MENSSIGRLVAVLVSPLKTFRSLAERPTWGVALLVLVALTALVALLAAQRVDFEATVREAVAERGQEMTETEIESAVGTAERFGVVAAVASSIVVQPLLYLCAAAAFWVGWRLLGAELDFKSTFAVFVHAMMPWAVAALVSIPVLLTRESIGPEELERGSFLVADLGVLAGEDAPAALSTLLASVSLFSVWSIALLTLGYSAVTRRSRASAAGLAVALWVLWLAARVGWAVLRS